MPADLVLIVNGDLNLIQLTRPYLELEGFRVLTASNKLTTLEAAASQNPALIILDGSLSEAESFEICRGLREDQNQVPLLLIIRNDLDIDQFTSLELGADDYLTKPFNPRELVARVKAFLRRNRYTPGTAAAVLHAGDLSIDPFNREVHSGGWLLDLRPQEFEVLRALAIHYRQTLTCQQLLNLAWGFDFPGQTTTVDFHVAALRRKLMNTRARIETVVGEGYRLVG